VLRINSDFGIRRPAGSVDLAGAGITRMAGAHRSRRFRRHDFFLYQRFIITRLMISEWDKTGTISIKNFIYGGFSG
jgi:hypothetical protein